MDKIVHLRVVIVLGDHHAMLWMEHAHLDVHQGGLVTRVMKVR